MRADEAGPVCLRARADGGPACLWMTIGADGRLACVERGLASGEGERVRNLFCATKPMVALGILAALDERGLDWTTLAAGPRATMGPDQPWPIVDLLAHRTPLAGPTVWEVLRWPVERVEDELGARAGAVAAGNGERWGFSDVLAWHVLGRAASGAIGPGWVGELQHGLRAAVGPELWLAPDDQLLALPVERLATLTSRRGPAEVPLVHGLGRRSRSLVSPHLGGYGAFTGMVRWLSLLGRHLSGDGERTVLWPSAARLRSAGLEAHAAPRPAGPGGRAAYVAGLQRFTGPGGRPLVGLQAGVGALGAWLDLSTARVVGVLGAAFLDAPAERSAWVGHTRAAAWAWASSGPESGEAS